MFDIPVPTTKSISVALIDDSHSGLWLFKRNSKHQIGKWEMVTGKADGEEDHHSAAMRESYEEAGVSVSGSGLREIGAILATGEMIDAPYDGPVHLWDHHVFATRLPYGRSPMVREPHVHDECRLFTFAEIENRSLPLSSLTACALPFIRNLARHIASDSPPVSRTAVDIARQGGLSQVQQKALGGMDLSALIP